jgi:hypothetical protein
MQQCTVRATESMPIDSLQTISFPRYSYCPFLEIDRRERKALAFREYQCAWRAF